MRLKTFHVYYIKQVLLYLFLSLLLFCVLYVAIDLISNFRKYGDTLTEIWGNFSLKLPSIFYQMQAVSLFLANTIVLSLIYARREYVVLKTSGISLKRVYAPLVALTLGLSIAFCVAYDVISPKVYMAQQLQSHGGDPDDKFQFSFINTKVWYQEGQEIFHIGYISPDTGELDDIQIFFFNRQFELTRFLQAQKAAVLNHQWRFEKGLIVEYQDNAPTSSDQFESLELTLSQSLEDLKKIQFDPRQLRVDQLYTFLREKRFRAADVMKYETDFYQRIVFAFFPLILLFTGAPIISVSRRSYSFLFNVGMTFIVSVTFWMLFKIFVTLGSSGKMDPLMATVCVPIVFVALGAFLWHKKK